MAGGPQHRRRPSQRSWPQRLAIALGVFVSFSCLLAATAVGYVYWKTGRFQRANLSLDSVAGGDLAARNYLIIGSDSRANIDPSDPDASAFIGGDDPTGQRSDTILLVRIDPVAGDAKMLSFPRDLWVPIAGTGHSAKINSAYGEGRQVLIDTIRENFGVQINNYIEVDFKGFKGLVDAVNGVPIYFDTAMRDGNTGLDIEQPGCVTLDGEQALAFARSRHLEYLDSKGRWQEDPTADLGRISRQQIFVRKAMSKALSLGIATDPVAFYDLLDTVTRSVTIDQTIDRGDMLALIQKFKDYKPEDMKTFALPVTNGTSSDGQSILNMKLSQAQPMLNIFRGADAGPVLESDVTVDVNTAHVGGLHSKDVQAALDATGFVDGTQGDTPAGLTQTTIRYAPGSELAADLLSRHLTTAGALLEADPSLAANHVVLDVGPDFSTVVSLPRTASTINTTTTVPTTGGGPTTTTAQATTTSTTVIGITPGATPDGVSC